MTISACVGDEYPHCTFEKYKPKTNLNEQMVLLREMVIEMNVREEAVVLR